MPQKALGRADGKDLLELPPHFSERTFGSLTSGKLTAGLWTTQIVRRL